MIQELDLSGALKDNVADVQASVTFECVWQLHSTRSKRSFQITRKAWVPAGIAAMIMIGLILSPSVRASVGNLIKNKIIKNSSKAIVYEGWVSSVEWDAVTSYPTLQDSEQAVGTRLPFPQQLLGIESERLTGN
ncbi:hypothetical protein [Paenibacillus sp. NPDC057934]|uniref:hypothetical protein n=1 Tax=Paenibacillus sp. NPDC057934 TaxID=3346282 RepID=UPI0036DC94C0